MIKTFAKRTLRPLTPYKVKRNREDRDRRGSARERGYDGAWDKKRLTILKRDFHLCQECLRRGYAADAALVDHVKPLADFPDLRLDDDNLESMCTIHHNGFKSKIEHHARKTNNLDLLPQWVKFPDSRPPRFQITRYGPLGKPKT